MAGMVFYKRSRDEMIIAIFQRRKLCLFLVEVMQISLTLWMSLAFQHLMWLALPFPHFHTKLILSQQLLWMVLQSCVEDGMGEERKS